MNFVLPPRSEVGYLDPEIANEGLKVTLENGSDVNWTPPPVKTAVPDISRVKSIQHYFGRTGGPTYPAWIFHPTEKDRIVQNAEEAGKYGVRYRKATKLETERYGVTALWDYDEDSLWRAAPQKERKIDPNNMEGGKAYVPPGHNPIAAQDQMVKSLVQAFSEVAKSIKGGAAPEKSSLTMDQIEEALLSIRAAKQAAQGNALAEPEDDRSAWAAAAERQGIKVDKRWGVERIKSEIEKAA